MNEEVLLSERRAARVARMRNETFRAVIAAGTIPAIRRGRCRYVLRADLEAWLAEQARIESRSQR